MDTTMMKTVRAELTLELTVECPYCEHIFDLMTDVGMNDEGAMIRAACPKKGIWSEEHKKFKEQIRCPECRYEMKIKGIRW